MFAVAVLFKRIFSWVTFVFDSIIIMWDYIYEIILQAIDYLY